VASLPCLPGSEVCQGRGRKKTVWNSRLGASLPSSPGPELCKGRGRKVSGTPDWRRPCPAYLVLRCAKDVVENGLELQAGGVLALRFTRVPAGVAVVEQALSAHS
jgi:hypothetical protein